MKNLFKIADETLAEARGCYVIEVKKKELKMLMPRIGFFSIGFVFVDKHGKHYCMNREIIAVFGSKVSHEVLTDYLIDKVGKTYVCGVHRGSLSYIKF